MSITFTSMNSYEKAMYKYFYGKQVPKEITRWFVDNEGKPRKIPDDCTETWSKTNPSLCKPGRHITKVIFNNPATIVMWSDGSKTVVKAGKDDIFDPEKGLTMAIVKKALGNTGKYYNEIKKWLHE